MPVITIASTKGGGGKSTLAVNLCTEFLHKQQKVALLDADPQGSAFKWNLVREALIADGEKLAPLFAASVAGQSLLDLSEEKSSQGCFVLIDSAGVDNQSTRLALVRSDLVLIVCAPSTLDLWEIAPLLQVIQNLGRTQKRDVPVLLLFNKVPTNPHVKSVSDAMEFLQENFIFPTYIFKAVLKDRIVYQHAIREGKGVVEYRPKNRQACREIREVAAELFSFITLLLKKEVV